MTYTLFLSRASGLAPLAGVLVLVLVVAGCAAESRHAEDGQPSTVKALPDSVFVAAEHRGAIPPEALARRTPESFASLKPGIEHAIDTYRLIYRTKDFVTGEIVRASAAVFVPDVDNATSVVSYQHGTIYPFEGDAKAPSNHNDRASEVMLCRLLAARGYVVIAPDYLGYGASKDRPHPYYLLDSQATTTWNGLRALARMADAQAVALDGRLLLTGYSQGGTTSMAVHRRMQAAGDTTFSVVASVNGGGVYHMPRFMDEVLAKEDLGTAQSDAGNQILNVYLWVFDTYLAHYDQLQQTWADIVVPPYAAQLDTAKTVFQVDLPSSPAAVFRDDFVEGFRTRQDTSLLAVMEANSNYRWSPQAPVRMVHGTADNIVPFENAEAAWTALRDQGTDTVDLIPVGGAGHGDTFARYLEVLVGTLQEAQGQPATATSSLPRPVPSSQSLSAR
jgi:pimeloyl-ACP methyl ester carboxylesterase